MQAITFTLLRYADADGATHSCVGQALETDLLRIETLHFYELQRNQSRPRNKTPQLRRRSM